MQTVRPPLTQEVAIRWLKGFVGTIMLGFAFSFMLRETATLTWFRTTYDIYPTAFMFAFGIGGASALLINLHPKVYLIATLPLMIYSFASFPIVTSRNITQPLPFLTTFSLWVLANALAWLEVLPCRRAVFQAGGK